MPDVMHKARDATRTAFLRNLSLHWQRPYCSPSGLLTSTDATGLFSLSCFRQTLFTVPSGVEHRLSQAPLARFSAFATHREFRTARVDVPPLDDHQSSFAWLPRDGRALLPPEAGVSRREQVNNIWQRLQSSQAGPAAARSSSSSRDKAGGRRGGSSDLRVSEALEQVVKLHQGPREVSGREASEKAAKDLTEALQRRGRGSSKGHWKLASCAAALAKLGGPSHGHRPAFEALAAAAMQCRTQFTPSSTALLLWAFARAGHDAPEVFSALTRAALPRLPEAANTQDLSQLAWAAAKATQQHSKEPPKGSQRKPRPSISSAPREVLDAAAALLAPRLSECSGPRLSMVLYAFAVAGHSAPGLFEAARAEAVRRAAGDGLGPREAANIAWAFAKAEHPAPEVFEALSGLCLTSMRKLRAVELSQVAWAFATAGHADSRLLEAFEAEASARMMSVSAGKHQGSSRGPPQASHQFALDPAKHLVTLMWAFAKLELQPGSPGLLEAAAAALEPVAPTLSPQALAMVAWSFARLEHPAASLFAKVRSAARARVGEFEPQGLAMLAWSSARAAGDEVESSSPDADASSSSADDVTSLMDAIVVAAKPHLGEFGPQGLPMLLWSAAKLRHPGTAELFEAAAPELLPSLDQLSLRGLAMLGSACCGAGPSGAELLVALLPLASSLLPGATPRDMATAAWGFCDARKALRESSHDIRDGGLRDLALLFDGLEGEAADRAAEFDPRSLATLLHSFARVGHPGERLLAGASGQASALARRRGPRGPSPHDLALLAWCYARSKDAATGAKVLKDVAEAFVPAFELSRLEPADLAHLAWAYSRPSGSSLDLARSAGPLLDRLAEQAGSRTGEFTEQGLASLAWAFASANRPASSLFASIAAEVCQRLSIATAHGTSFDPSALVMLAWAFSRSGEAQVSPILMGALLEAVSPRMDELGPQSLAMLLWSVARAKHHADWFFVEAHPLVMRRLCDFDSQGLAMVLWAFSTGSGLSMRDMCARACAEAIPRLRSVSTESLEMAVEAFEHAGESSEELHEAWRQRAVFRSLASAGEGSNWAMP